MGRSLANECNRLKAIRERQAVEEKRAADKAAERKKNNAKSLRSARALTKAVPVRSRTHACVYF